MSVKLQAKHAGNDWLTQVSRRVMRVGKGTSFVIENQLGEEKLKGKGVLGRLETNAFPQESAQIFAERK